MSRALKLIGFLIVAATAGAGASLLLHQFGGPTAGNNDVSYADFLSITLTALSLMVTVLGLFVAAAGVIGWSTLESKLRSHSVEYFSQQLEKGAPLRKDLEGLFAEIAYTGIEGLKKPGADEDRYVD